MTSIFITEIENLQEVLDFAIDQDKRVVPGVLLLPGGGDMPLRLRAHLLTGKHLVVSALIRQLSLVKCLLCKHEILNI